MKIIVLVSSLSCGGAERVATTLCNAWNARGDEVSLITTYLGKQKPFYPLSSGIKLIELSNILNSKIPLIIKQFAKTKKIRSLFINTNPDLIISFLPNVNITTILASTHLPIPIIVCERNYYKDVNIYLRLISRQLYRYADIVLAQTARAAHDLDRLYPKLKQTYYIQNPLPTEIYSFKKNKKARPEKILLAIGRLVEQKQMHLAISAFAKLSPNFPDWQLHIYGNGPLHNDLFSQITKLQMLPKIRLNDAAPNLWEIMSTADALVMTSNYEGFPNTLMEAMAIGLPCVAFDCPYGPRELSEDGRNILLVNLNDEQALEKALYQVMNDQHLRDELSGKSHEFVFKNNSLPKILAEWDYIFNQISLNT